MTHRGHDVMRARSGVSEESSKGFAQTMRFAIERKSSRRHRVAHPATEAIYGEGLAVLLRCKRACEAARLAHR